MAINSVACNAASYVSVRSQEPPRLLAHIWRTRSHRMTSAGSSTKAQREVCVLCPKSRLLLETVTIPEVFQIPD